MKTIPFTIKNDKTLDLTDLLPRLPDDLILKNAQQQELSADEKELLTKIGKASNNANVPVLQGIAAIGELLAYAAGDASESTIQDIGWLIQSLGEQAAAISRLKNDTESIIQQDSILKKTVTKTMS